MGGKPSKGTSADGRLSGNKPKGSGSTKRPAPKAPPKK